MINSKQFSKIILVLWLFLLNNHSISQVQVTVPDTSGKEGKRITIPINVSDLTESQVKSYKFKLQFDPKILKAKRVKDDGTLSDRFSWDVDKDINKDNIIVEAKGWLSLQGSGTLINIVFEVV